jgi:hypothetical protein
MGRIFTNLIPGNITAMRTNESKFPSALLNRCSVWQKTHNLANKGMDKFRRILVKLPPSSWRDKIMKKVIRQIQTIAIVGSLLILSGCETPYQPNGLLGGYSDTELAPDLYRVNIRGDDIATFERIQDFALLRASELTLQHGFSYFAIINERNAVSVSSVTTPGRADTTVQVNGQNSGNLHLNPNGASYSDMSSAYLNAQTIYTPPQTYHSFSPRTELLVKAFQTKPAGFFTFDASFLQQSLKKKYRIK